MSEQWTPEQIAAMLACNEPPYRDRKLIFIKGQFAGEVELPAQPKPLYEMSGTIYYGGSRGGGMGEAKD